MDVLLRKQGKWIFSLLQRCNHFCSQNFVKPQACGWLVPFKLRHRDDLYCCTVSFHSFSAHPCIEGSSYSCNLRAVLTLKSNPFLLEWTRNRQRCVRHLPVLRPLCPSSVAGEWLMAMVFFMVLVLINCKDTTPCTFFFSIAQASLLAALVT